MADQREKGWCASGGITDFSLMERRRSIMIERVLSSRWIDLHVAHAGSRTKKEKYVSFCNCFLKIWCDGGVRGHRIDMGLAKLFSAQLTPFASFLSSSKVLSSVGE